MITATNGPDLLVRFQPLLVIGSSLPFAWSAISLATCGRSFAATAAMLPPEARAALEIERITRSIEGAVDAGLADTGAQIAVPVSAAGGSAPHLLGHLIRTAFAHGLACERLVVEINADERGDLDRAASLAEACAARGLAVALDHFSAGPLALKLLARFTPRFVKLDASLVRGIDASASRRFIAEGVMRLARAMGVTVVARGAQTQSEHDALDAIGVRHVQFDMATAPIPPRAPRREPRTVPMPEHRRLAHHQRAFAPLRADATQTGVAGAPILG